MNDQGKRTRVTVPVYHYAGYGKYLMPGDIVCGIPWGDVLRSSEYARVTRIVKQDDHPLDGSAPVVTYWLYLEVTESPVKAFVGQGVTVTVNEVRKVER